MRLSGFNLLANNDSDFDIPNVPRKLENFQQILLGVKLPNQICEL